MAFYPQFPAFYAYPMPYPSQEFYAMYPPGSNAGVDGHPAAPNGGSGPVYFDGGNMHGGKNSFVSNNKPGFNNRKDSSDSGISDFSSFSSRKTSSTSTISNLSSHGIMEESALDDVKEEEPYEEPDDDLCDKIVAQVEFYFGDANITKDKFLLKHVKRNKEGFVSLKLISSFKRVKHLTKDWRQVAEAIERKSNKLEVNDVKTKVRRLEALPEYDETTPSRTVVALNLPLERPTIEAVAEIFSVCGEIVLVRILRPGNPIPADIKPFANKHPEMTSKVCALVEFERTEFALKAVKDLNQGQEQMVVMELTAPPPKSTKSKEDKRKPTPPAQARPLSQGPVRRFSHAGFGQQAAQIQQQHGNSYNHQQDDQQGPRRRISLYHNMKFTPIAEEPSMGAAKGGKELGLNPNAPTFTMHHRRMAAPRANFMHGMPPEGLMMPHPAAAAAAYHHAAAAAAAAYPSMIRRISATGGVEIAASGLALPPNVIRLPRGPEKNAKGFQKWCRNRMQAATPAAPAERKSRAVPIVAPPTEEEEKAPEESAPAVPAAPASPPPAVDSSDSGNEDEGHFSDQEVAAAAPAQPAEAQGAQGGFQAAMLNKEEDLEKSR